MEQEKGVRGYFIETYGGNRYTSIAWYKTLEEAEKERKRIVMIGAWSGMPPRILKDYELQSRHGKQHS